jgi:hypothetical protein
MALDQMNQRSDTQVLHLITFYLRWFAAFLREIQIAAAGEATQVL